MGRNACAAIRVSQSEALPAIDSCRHFLGLDHVARAFLRGSETNQLTAPSGPGLLSADRAGAVWRLVSPATRPLRSPHRPDPAVTGCRLLLPTGRLVGMDQHAVAVSPETAHIDPGRDGGSDRSAGKCEDHGASNAAVRTFHDR